MSAFDRIAIAYSYTSFAEALGDGSFPGTQQDSDLDQIEQRFNAAMTTLDGIVRDDGQLQNGVVTRESLGPDITIGISATRPWVTATAYVAGDTVSVTNSIYLLVTPHTSGVFATDLAAGKWVLLITFTAETSVPDGSVTTVKIVDLNVTTAKLANLSVTTGKLADGAVTAAKMSPAVGTVPIGAEVDFAGVVAPALWLLEYGQAVSRATYASLLAVLAPTFECDVTNASNTLVSTLDLEAYGLVGSVLEGPGIPVGATITAVSGTSITMSAVATFTTANASVQFFPHGAGDGSTTFNVPDARDRVTVGRGNMGGTAAARIDQAIGPSNRLGQAGGVDDVVLTTAEMPAHTHTGTTSSNGAHTHTFNDAGIAAGGGLAAGADFQTNSPLDTTSSNGAHTHTFTTASTGGGAAHTNLQPFKASNRIIYAGAA